MKAQQTAVSEYEVKAAFLYNFTRFVDWPKEAFSDKSEPFIIGITGDNPFGSYLHSIVAGETVDTRPIIIKHYKSITDLEKCHILFINSNDIEYIKKVLRWSENKNILTINESISFVRQGGHIRFYTEKNRIKLQINATEAKKSGLNISSKLLSISKVY